ncbi:FkbM family methyltransferase [Leptolinea sp. HRD-7]|nr:FkbM family methyltransferase [Leptolinea sp. HRD-7]
MKHTQRILYYIKSIFSLLVGFTDPILILRIFLSRKSTPLFSVPIKLRKNGLNFFIRNPMDVWSIKETFLDDFYHFENYPRPKTGFIVDIGAGIGEFAIQAAAACPGCQVFGFEPFEQSCAYFRKNIETNSLTNVMAISAAVTSTSDNLALDVSSGNPLQFKSKSSSAAENSVDTVRLFQFLDEHSIPFIDLLKLDCEGGEYDILLPLSNQELRRIKRIVMEYHNGLTEHLHVEIIEKLRKAGFAVESHPNFVHDSIGYIYAKLM